MDPSRSASSLLVPMSLLHQPSQPHAYRSLVQRRIAVLGALVVLLCALLMTDLVTGPAGQGFGDLWRAIFGPNDMSGPGLVIIRQVRLPIALMALVAGAALAVAGAQMQTILGNALASPFTLGVSAAASFGAAIGLVTGFGLPGTGDYLVPINAFLMALAATLFIDLASRLWQAGVETVVLLGIALVFTFNALLALLQYVASEQALAAVVFWTMGSLQKASWTHVGLTTAMLVFCLPLLARRAWTLTALRLGDDRAASFGVKVGRIRLEVMMLVALLTAVPVAFVGTIGFVGLVGPHIARMLVGEDQRFFLPASALAGAAMLSASSVLSKVLVPGVVLPIGIVTAIAGLPVFFALVLTRGRRR